LKWTLLSFDHLECVCVFSSDHLLQCLIRRIKSFYFSVITFNFLKFSNSFLDTYLLSQWVYPVQLYCYIKWLYFQGILIALSSCVEYQVQYVNDILEGCGREEKFAWFKLLLQTLCGFPIEESNLDSPEILACILAVILYLLAIRKRRSISKTLLQYLMR